MSDLRKSHETRAGANGRIYKYSYYELRVCCTTTDVPMKFDAMWKEAKKEAKEMEISLTRELFLELLLQTYADSLVEPLTVQGEK